MSGRTYKIKGIVLKKTKLGESDLIATLLGETGAKIQVVAKGARKPSSKASAHFDLFNTLEILCAKGKTLDIATETRMLKTYIRIHNDPKYVSAATSLGEILLKVTQPDLETERLFDLAEASFYAIDNAETVLLDALVAAAALKIFAFEGVRPSFRVCIICGRRLPQPVSTPYFSVDAGGVLCEACAGKTGADRISPNTLRRANLLLMSPFASIVEASASDREVLDLIQRWSLSHIFSKIKALDYFLAIE